MADAADQAPFWERPMDGETHTAFMAFTTYRDLGITRSLRQAAKAFYSREDQGYQADTGELPTGAQLTRFKRWSGEFSWVARVEAHDLEEARRRALVMQERRLKMVETQYQLARNGQAVVADRFREFVRGETRLPNSVLPSFLTAVTNLERITLGEATIRTEEVGKGAQQPDYSSLTDQEIEFLDDIGKKLYGGG